MGILQWVATHYNYKTLGGRPMRKRNKIPFFVYGTLMTGFGNYKNLLEGLTVKEVPATTKGVMYSAGGFPAMMKDSKEIVHGQVMWVPDNIYYKVLADLDFLEGYDPYNKEHSMYLREKITATTSDGEEIECWGYIWNMGMNYLRGRIHSGSWRLYTEEKIENKKVKGGVNHGKVSTW